MTRARTAATALFAFRIAYGAGLIAVPGKVTRSWLGPGATTHPSLVALRGLGGREIAVHGVALAAAARGGDVRPWALASILGDVTDVLATTASRSGLPAGAAPKTLAVAGGSAVLTAAVAAAVSRAG